MVVASRAYSLKRVVGEAVSFCVSCACVHCRDVIEHVTHIKNPTILAGHSLGGGLAHITASLTGKTSITFSSPGILESRRKFSYRGRRVRARDSYHQAVAVTPDLDFIRCTVALVALLWLRVYVMGVRCGCTLRLCIAGVFALYLCVAVRCGCL